MNTLHALGSGSKGNAFALTSAEGILLLEAGFSCRELERRLALVGLDPARIIAIAVTHEHGDHARGATRLARRLSIPVVASPGTWRALSRGGEPCDWVPTGSRGPAVVGPFTIAACPCPHDAAEPLALAVEIADGPTLAIATDLGRPTQALRYFLRERHCLILEANYDEVLLRTSGYPATVQQRIAGAGGHLSNGACGALLAEVHHQHLVTVVLAHLSQRCNTPDVARRTVTDHLTRAGYTGSLHVAHQDDPIGPIALHAPPQRALF